MSKMLAESYIRIILYVYFYRTSKSDRKRTEKEIRTLHSFTRFDETRVVKNEPIDQEYETVISKHVPLTLARTRRSHFSRGY